jgi:hypothetical protein
MCVCFISGAPLLASHRQWTACTLQQAHRCMCYPHDSSSAMHLLPECVLPFDFKNTGHPTVYLCLQGVQSSAGRTATQGALGSSQTASQGGSLTVRRRLSKCASCVQVLTAVCRTNISVRDSEVVRYMLSCRADSQRAGILANMRRREAAFTASALARHRKVRCRQLHIANESCGVQSYATHA